MTTTTALSMPQCAWPSGGVSDLSKLAHECRPPALVGSKLDDKVTNNILPTPNLRGHCRVPIGGRLSLSLSLCVHACACAVCVPHTQQACTHTVCVHCTCVNTVCVRCICVPHTAHAASARAHSGR